MKLFQDQKGQATIEAAFLLPFLLLLVLLLLQPGIVLFDKIVMNQAAAEGCRRVMTGTVSLDTDRVNEGFIRRRFGGIPPQDNFHIHQGACSWSIDSKGKDASGKVSVAITNELEPLPLLGWGADLSGMLNGKGGITLSADVMAPAQPSWVASNPEGSDPDSWVGGWLRED